MMERHDDIELKSDEIRVILSTPPKRLVQYGTFVITIIFLLLFIGSICFTYPETAKTNIIITTENPPIRLYAKTSGQLTELYVKDQESIKRGKILASIENVANINDVIMIDKKINSININDSLIPILFPINTELGILQREYNDFLIKLKEYNDFYTIRQSEKKIIYTQSYLNEYDIYLCQLKEQEKIDSLISTVVKNDFERDHSLFANNIISPSSYDQVKRQYLEKNRESVSLNSYISYANIEKKRIQNELEELRIDNYQIKKKIHLQLLNSINELKSAIKEWELLYIIKSPIDGIISYSNIRKKFEFINKGDEVFSIINSLKGKSVGYATLESTGLGKVKKGQRVNIQLDGYPYMEYGFLIGYIEQISLIPNQGRYIVIVRIPQDFKTSYGKVITFNGELSGVAEIITDNRSLIMRLIHPLRYIVNHNMQ